MFGDVYASKCGKGDVITMTLDMTGDKYATLSYKVSGIDHGIAFDNINIERPYSMTFS